MEANYGRLYVSDIGDTYYESPTGHTYDVGEITNLRAFGGRDSTSDILILTYCGKEDEDVGCDIAGWFCGATFYSNTEESKVECCMDIWEYIKEYEIKKGWIKG